MKKQNKKKYINELCHNSVLAKDKALEKKIPVAKLDLHLTHKKQ